MFRQKNKNLPRRNAAAPTGRQNVFSYYASRSVPEQNVGRNELRREMPPTWLDKLKNLPVILSSIVIIGSLLYALTLSSTPQMVIVDDTNQSLKRPVKTYQEYVNSEAKRSLLNQFKLTIDTVAMESKLKQQFPEIDTANITVPLLGRQPFIELTTIMPSFALTTNANEAYFISPSGRATARVSDYTVRPQGVITVEDQSGLHVEPGGQILTKTTVSFINEVIFQMQAKNISVASFMLPPNPFELRMNMEGEKYYVKFNTVGDARLQAGAFLAVRDRLKADKQSPAEYIDVRVEDRAFYK